MTIPIMKENGPTTKRMEEEKSKQQMEQFTLETSKTVSDMEQEDWKIQTVAYLREAFRMEKSTEKENSSGQMAKDTKEIGLKE